MEKPLKTEEFEILWDSLNAKRKKEMMMRIDNFINEVFNNKPINIQTHYNFCLNFAFDQEEPIQYVYIEGVFYLTITNVNKQFVNHLIKHLQYIEVSDNPDNFLDRRDEIKNSSEGHTIKDSQDENIKESINKNNSLSNISNPNLYFKTLHSTSLSAFDEKLEKACQEGFIPNGNMIIIQDKQGDYNFYQQLVKTGKPRDLNLK